MGLRREGLLDLRAKCGLGPESLKRGRRGAASSLESSSLRTVSPNAISSASSLRPAALATLTYCEMITRALSELVDPEPIYLPPDSEGAEALDHLPM
jgi:hypothetical protein